MRSPEVHYPLISVCLPYWNSDQSNFRRGEHDQPGG